MKNSNSDVCISIIVPIYNVEKYIRKCIDSLLSQTLKGIEIILVDDGTPDNCGAIIDDYADKYDNIVVLHKENGGLSDARNAGMKVASGEYIGFADPDDYAEPDMFEKLYNSIRNNDFDLAICGYKEVFSDRLSYERKMTFLNNAKSIGCLIDSYLNGNFGTYAWNKLYKASIVKDNKIEFPVGVQLVEDTIFFFTYINYIKSFSIVDECLYNYIRNSNSICAKFHDNEIEYKKLVISKIEKAVDTISPSLNDKRQIMCQKNTCKIFMNMLDNVYSPKNKAKLGQIYKKTKEIANDEFFRVRIKDCADIGFDKKKRKKIEYVLKRKMKMLFLYEFFEVRIREKIQYYFG